MLSITNTVRGLFARPATPSRPRPRRRPLRLECLEQRTLLCNPGELDLTFDGDGKVTTDFGGVQAGESASSVVTQADGKIVAAGRSVRSLNSLGFVRDVDWALARYNPDGSLDPSFGSGGKVLTSFYNGNGFSTNFTNPGDAATDVAIQSDGKIVAAGYATKLYDLSDFAVARYKTDGALDKTFGSSGKVKVDLGGHDAASAVAIQADGKIVVGGRGATNCSNCQSPFILVRLNPNGSLDSTFGTGGKVLTYVSTVDNHLEDLAIQSNGKIVGVGSSGGQAGLGNDLFTVLRWNSNGTLDSAFGTGGSTTTMIAGGFGAFASMALQTDGKIVAGGTAGIGSEGAISALARFNTDGSFDSTFDTDGIVTTDITGPIIDLEDRDAVNGIAIQADGRIVAAGRYGSGINDHVAVLRYNTNGSLDTSFDSDGIVTTSIGTRDQANAVAIQSDGDILIGGGSDGNFLLARYCA